MTDSSTQSPKGNILVVDDTAANLRLLVDMLSRSGYRVRPALNGKLAILGAQAKPPDVILLDIMMPEMDGYEVCQRLKADPKTQDVPVIFLSALNDSLDKVKAFAAGGVDYITKPFQQEEVIARIENQLRVRHLSQQIISQNQELERFSQSLKELQRINSQSYESFEALCQDYLATGCNILELTTGVISRVRGQACELISRYNREGELPPDPILSSLSQSSCALVVDQKTTILQSTRENLEEGENPGQNPPYFYLATPIWVNGVIYATLAFSSPEERIYSQQDIEIVELMAQSLGKIIKSHELELQRQQAEEEVKLLLTISQAISDAHSFEKALEIALNQVCEKTGWIYGEAWVESDDHTALECRCTWVRRHLPEELAAALGRLQDYSQALLLLPEDEIPGQIWQSKQSQWVTDVSLLENDTFLRLELAKEGGLRAAFGVPILNSENRVLAALIFFMVEAREQDERLCQLVKGVAAQLGQVIQQKQTEAELRGIFAAMTDQVLLYDRAGVCLKVAPTKSQSLTHPPDWLPGKTVRDIFPKDIADLMLDTLHRVLDEQEAATIEYCLEQPHREAETLDSSPLAPSSFLLSQDLWLSATISPLSEDIVIVVARDVSDRKATEAALQQSEQRYREMVEAQKDVLVCRWKPDTTLTFVNQSYANYQNSTPDHLIGSKFVDFLDESSRQEFSPYLESLLTHLRPDTHTNQMRSGSGQSHWFSWTDQPIFDQNGHFIEFQSFGVDITAQKQREQALQLIAQGTAVTTGNEFFRSCARSLAQLMQVRYAMITQVANPERTRVKTLAFWLGEDFGEDFEYDLIDTPCQLVMEGYIAYHPENVQDEFPNDLDLVDLQAQSYLGIPLKTKEGVVIGNLAILDVKPLQRQREQELILEIFAARAGAELERKRAEERLQQRAATDNLLSNIARAFIDQGLNVAIEFTLDAIATFTQSDRSLLFRFDSTTSQYSLSAQYIGPDIAPFATEDPHLTGLFVLLESLLIEQDLLVIGDRHHLPFDAALEQQALEQANLNSILIVPMVYGGVSGAVALANVQRPKTWTDDDQQLLKFVGELIAISQAKHDAEEALQESESQYRTLYNNTPALLHSCDANLRIISVSDYWLEFTGYQREEVIGKMFVDFMTSTSRSYALEAGIPSFLKIGKAKDVPYQLRKKNGDIVDILLSEIIEHHASGRVKQSLAVLIDVTERKRAEAALRLAQQQSERLLLNILPHRIADKLKRDSGSIADQFESVTIIFADLVGFTPLSAKMSATEIVNLLNQVFSLFDKLADWHGLEKIKTIGDAYMAVGGLPIPREDHAESVVDFALDIQNAIGSFQLENGDHLSLRIGINTGPVVAGVIGIKKFIYDLWGDTVNVASRMESQGKPGQIQVTKETYERLKDRYLFAERGAIDVKGRGMMTTYWLLGRKVD
ncbi:PAS domain S-box protein [Spirulina subsalsa FACHB-351]|uniref:PAS domain S-box protein n=1 Tax=Spirulina subsalsa FACHB-351 TaxID=234711 RepID=A0ABT3L5A8_9CYAN|nr:adenylate/guanylate cyclase domain-containing protein [Spirulina subsalsa]MCW6036632.1 PAS domain S-box protein [Spirulina subsalsa FACHB-351]